jgi:hypothetical protein
MRVVLPSVGASSSSGVNGTAKQGQLPRHPQDWPQAQDGDRHLDRKGSGPSSRRGLQRRLTPPDAVNQP